LQQLTLAEDLLHCFRWMNAPLQVLDFELQRQLVPYMKDLVPLPGIYDADFIAANQDARADNIIKGNKKDQVEAPSNDSVQKSPALVILCSRACTTQQSRRCLCSQLSMGLQFSGFPHMGIKACTCGGCISLYWHGWLEGGRGVQDARQEKSSRQSSTPRLYTDSGQF